MFLFGKIFKTTLIFIILAELFSIFGYLLTDFRQISFFIIIFIILILALYKLEYGILILLAELFIGSKGYLFYFEYEGIIISIRIALWLIIMSVWFGKLISHIIKNKKIQFNFLNIPYFRYYLILFLFIFWGLINGFLNNNEFSNIFFDFNGWLYFALLLPISGAIKNKENIFNIFQVLMASIIWLSIKTLFLLFAFSHNLIGMTHELYRWVRTTGVGEITQIQGGFYRIFFQSHIFVLAGFIIMVLLIADYIYINNKDNLFKDRYFFILLFCASGLLSTIIISFSRSFWLGLGVGLLLCALAIIKIYGRKKLFLVCLVLLSIILMSAGIIFAVIKFPYPRPLGGFSTAELLSERASKITGEPAISSRWTLLPELWNKIKLSYFFGQGFGSTLTYQSSDPRILESSPTGEYTTYAFEWGWLDIWLKLGIFGLISYFILIINIIYKSIGLNNYPWLTNSLIIGLITITVVNVFSPYFNHPLGIGYLLLASTLIIKNKENNMGVA